MSIQEVIDAINEGLTSDEIKHLIEEFHIDVDEPVGELRLRALHHAVYKDRFDCVKLFTRRGCDINARDQCGYTPLHIAARYNRTELANEIISMGARVDAPDSLGCAPLHMALQKGHLKCAEVLLQHGADPNTYYKGIGYEIHTLPGIYSDCLELLLSYGADPNVRDTQGLTPLHHATRASNTLYAYILLQNGADPNATTQTNAPEQIGKTALQMSLFSDSKSIIEILLLYGADPNCKDEHKNSPLHHVASRGYVEIAKLLIENGAVVTARNSFRYHPLHSACGVGVDPGMIELLLSNGAFVNSTTSLRDTPVKCVLSYWQQVVGDINNHGHRHDDEVDDILQARDEQCCHQLLSLLDHGARLTISNRRLDPFSVLNILPFISKMKRTRSLLLQASMDTSLLTADRKTPEEFKTTEYQDILTAAINPVSLRQACRRVIRKTLGKTNLPEAVKCLQLPVILQAYLTFRTN